MFLFIPYNKKRVREIKALYILFVPLHHNSKRNR